MAKNKSIWFRKIRGSYLPTSIIGLGIYLLYVLYIVVLTYDWLRLGYHVWPLLTSVIPLVVLAAIVTQCIASKHSK